MLRDINFKVFRKLLRKGKLKSITIDIDSCVINVEGHQEGAVKGYNPKKTGNKCYNLQFAFCDELIAYDYAHLQLVFAVQAGLRKGSGIPAAN